MKVFTVSGDSAFFWRKSSEEFYADVFLWTSTGKKKKWRDVVTLRSKGDLEREVFLAKESLLRPTEEEQSLLNEVREWAFSALGSPAEFSPYSAEEIKEMREENLRKAKDALDFLGEEPYALEAPEREAPISSVLTQAPKMDRAEAEKMIRFYLQHQGFEAVRLRWERPKVL